MSELLSAYREKLPKRWKTLPLKDICIVVPTGVEKFSGERNYFSTGSIKNGSITSRGLYTHDNKPSRANRISKINDVFQARMKETQKALLVNHELNGNLFSTGFIQLRSNRLYDISKFLYYFVQSPNFLIQRDLFSTGSTQVALTDDGFKKIYVSVPPIKEQKRIVLKIEELFSILDNVELTLNETKSKLAIFTDSIIANAFNRKFTIFMKNDSTSFWNDIQLEHVLEKHGIFDGPFGSNLKTKDYTSFGIRVIRLENIKKLYFDDSKQSYINPKKYQKLKTHTVVEGDIIFSSFVDSNIKCCMIPKFDEPAINKADCFCIRPNKEQILSEFLTFQLCSQQFYLKIKQEIHGITRKRVNTRQLRKSNIKICSKDEQKEIIRIININMNLINYMLSEVDKQHSNVKSLKKIILKQAFNGKLISQDPNDDPVEPLLQKIKQENEQLIQKQKALRKKNVK